MSRLRLLPLLLLPLVFVAGCGCRREAPRGKGEVEPPKALPARVTHVLCYHTLTETPKSVYDVKPTDFQEQLQALKDGGVQTINCRQLADYLAGTADLPAKSVIISFDDGRASVLKVAKPLLDQFGFQAVLFINPQSVGAKGFMSWDDLKGLAQAGYEIDSHTTTHMNLTRKPKSQSMQAFLLDVRKEIEDSFRTISEKMGVAPVALAYPFGNYDENVMRATKEVGYRLGLSIDPGAIDGQSNPWMLPRKMIVDGTSLKTFQRYLETEPLHLTSVDPSIGERLKTRSYQLTAQVLDKDAVADLQVEGGRGAKVKVDEATGQITVTTRLNRGANLIRLHAPGPPRREAAWIVVADVSN